MSNLAEIKEKLIGKPQNYFLQIDREQVNDDSRTVNLAFASDKPVEHWFGCLRLSMDKKCVRSDRLKSGAPLLLDHNRRQQIGVVENFSLDKDGMARADVRFSKSELAEEIYQDVKDGIRRNVSVGFMIYSLELESEKKGEPPVYRCDDWEPLEISIVSIPADASVGVGREFEEKPEEKIFEPAPETREITKPKEETMGKENEENKPVETVTRAADITKELVDFGTIFGERDLALDFAAQGKSVDDLRAAIAEKRQKSTPIPPKPAEQVARENGIQLATTVHRGKLVNFRGEKAHDVAYRCGQFLLAALTRNENAVEYCRQNGIALTRVHSSSSNETGGFLVPVEFENVLIDLRNEYGVFRQYANVVPMNSEAKERPRRTGGLTAYPIGAKGASRTITESTKNWDMVSLVAKQWGVLTKYENELSEDAVINIADDLAGEIAYAFTIKEDECGFIGDGSSDYHGIQGVATKLKNLSGTIANIAGLQVATGNAYSEIVLNDFIGVKKRLPQYAYKRSMPRWYVSTSFYYDVMEKLKLAAPGALPADYAAGANELRFLGFPVVLTEVMPQVEANSQVCALFGALELGVMFGDRRGVTIAMTDSHDDDFANNLMTIRGTERFDINAHDVGNASATATSRVAGPIVGLITAAS